MKTVGEIRRENLEWLIERVGKLEAVASAAGTTSVYLSQIRNQAKDNKSGRPREMGSSMARRIEAAYAMPSGWLDVTRTAEDADSQFLFVKKPPNPTGLMPAFSRASRSASEPMAPPDLVALLGAAIAAVPTEQRDRVVDLCATLAKAPDSPRVQSQLSDVLVAANPAPVRTWRQMASMTADRWPVESQRKLLAEFVDAVDKFAAAHAYTPLP